MGSETVYTPQLHSLLVDALRAGNSLRDACEYAGLKWVTFMAWRRRVLKGDRFHEGVVALIDSYEQAAAQGTAALIARLNVHSKKDPKSAMYLISRRDEQEERRERVRKLRAERIKTELECRLAELKIKAGGVEHHAHTLAASVVVLPELDADGAVEAESRPADPVSGE